MDIVPPAFVTCPEKITCPGTDYPISNFSSEAPDVFVFCGMAWPSGTPALNSTWTSQGCFAIVCSNISQEDANVKAASSSITCQTPAITVTNQNGQWQATGCFGTVYSETYDGVVALANSLMSICVLDPNFLPSTLNGAAIPNFCNSPVTGTVGTPGGGTFSYPIDGGIICSNNSDLTNQMAQSYANNQAAANAFWVDNNNSDSNPLHLVGNNADFCQNSSYNFEPFVKISGASSAFDITVLGSLPPALLLFQDSDTTATINEIASTTGNFTFTIQAKDRKSNLVARRQYQFTVMGITDNKVLPQAVAKQFYSFQFHVNGGVPPYTFSTDNRCPPWLFIYPTGLIQGTPDYSNTGNTTKFSVNVSDANGVLCGQEFTLSVVSTVQITFNIPNSGTQCSSYTGTVTIAPIGSSVVIASSSLTGLPTGITASKSTDPMTGIVTYTLSGTCWSAETDTITASGTDNFGFTGTSTKTVTINSVGLPYATAVKDIVWILQVNSSNGAISYGLTPTATGVKLFMSANSNNLAGASIRAYGYMGRCAFSPSYPLSGSASITQQTGGRINAQIAVLITQPMPVTLAACSWLNNPPQTNNQTYIQLNADNFNGVGYDNPFSITMEAVITPSIPTGLVSCP